MIQHVLDSFLFVITRFILQMEMVYRHDVGSKTLHCNFFFKAFTDGNNEVIKVIDSVVTVANC